MNNEPYASNTNNSINPSAQNYGQSFRQPEPQQPMQPIYGDQMTQPQAQPIPQQPQMQPMQGQQYQQPQQQIPQNNMQPAQNNSNNSKPMNMTILALIICGSIFAVALIVVGLYMFVINNDEEQVTNNMTTSEYISTTNKMYNDILDIVAPIQQGTASVSIMKKTNQEIKAKCQENIEQLNNINVPDECQNLRQKTINFFQTYYDTITAAEAESADYSNGKITYDEWIKRTDEENNKFSAADKEFMEALAELQAAESAK